MKEDAQVAGRMPRTMQHFQHLITIFQAIACLQPAVRREILDRGKTEHLNLLLQRIDPESIIRVWSDNRNPVVPGNHCRRTNMVQVTMRECDHDRPGALP